MAKDKDDSNTGKNPKEKNTTEKKSFLKDERVRFTIGLFALLLSIYILISFISYLFTWKVDQSFEWQNLFSGSDIRVKNWTGKLGASISALFMNKWFGISSLAFPLIIAEAGCLISRFRQLTAEAQRTRRKERRQVASKGAG